MQVLHCDICGEVLQSKYYILGMSEVQKILTDREEKEIVNNWENFIAEYMYAQPKNTKYIVKEICPACYHVFCSFIAIRLEELKKIRKEITGLNLE